MHTIIVNGSPRGTNGNSQIIINKFLEGYTLDGNTNELFCITAKDKWDEISIAISKAENIIVVFPLYAELLPGSLLEFFEYLSNTKLSKNNKMSFILHSGNLIAGVRGCCKQYLAELTKSLGCDFGGVLVRGNSFFYFNIGKEKANELVEPYAEMGKHYSKYQCFFGNEVNAFAGPTKIEKPESRVINRICKILMTEFGEKANCKFPLNDRPYEK